VVVLLAIFPHTKIQKSEPVYFSQREVPAVALATRAHLRIANFVDNAVRFFRFAQKQKPKSLKSNFKRFNFVDG